MTSTPPPVPGTPDQDPHPAPAFGGPPRQPPLVPYQPPHWTEDAPVAQDPYAPPAGPSQAGFPTTPPPSGASAHSPYGAPGTPVYGTPPPADPYGSALDAGQYPPGYGPQPGWPPTPSWNASFAPPPRQNGLALASMITSLAGTMFCLVPGIIGLILGIVALGQISRDGSTGRGFAITGIVVGAISLFFIALVFVAVYGPVL